MTSSKTKGHDPSIQLSNRGMTIVNKSNPISSPLHQITPLNNLITFQLYQNSLKQ